MSERAASPLATSRTASVTLAPATASARAVSTPIPEAAPVTIAFLPRRSIPATTSIAVEPCPNLEVRRSAIAGPSTESRRGEDADAASLRSAAEVVAERDARVLDLALLRLAL